MCVFFSKFTLILRFRSSQIVGFAGRARSAIEYIRGKIVPDTELLAVTAKTQPLSRHQSGSSFASIRKMSGLSFINGHEGS